MTISRGPFILVVGILLGALLALSIAFTALGFGHGGWPVGIFFSGGGIYCFAMWTVFTED